jgi:alkanesulfonate monooxygenase SsuD/methylene tetrahydromethanopterin reductase-like flavin-dependent oxidoreductase (luciferase family)
MEFGMFHEFPSLPGRSESEAFDEAMEQVDAGERLGLDVLPPIRIAASTPDTFPAIGRRGAPIFASVRHASWADLKTQIESYRAAWERAGHPGRGRVFVSAPTYLAETEAEARAEPRESIIHFYAEQAKLLEGAARLVDRETAARRMQRVHDLRQRSYEEAIEANALIGTPDAIADKLAALQSG